MPTVSLAQESPSVNLTFRGHLVSVKVTHPSKNVYIGGPRGVVNEFSKASRLRILKLCASLDDVSTRASVPVFLTLTYGQSFPSPKRAKTHLRAFLERFRRRFSDCSAIWRFEFQQRGAPHFHLIVFNLPFVAAATIQKWWGAVIGREYWDYANAGSPREPFTRIEECRSWRKVMSYASKYVAKRGGDGGFNYDAYLHGDEFHHPVTGEPSGSIGRWWGVFNADRLPLAVAVVTAAYLPNAWAYLNFRRAARRVSKWAGKSAEKGFSLFVGDAEQWRKLAQFYEWQLLDLMVSDC